MVRPEALAPPRKDRRTRAHRTDRRALRRARRSATASRGNRRKRSPTSPRAFAKRGEPWSHSAADLVERYARYRYGGEGDVGELVRDVTAFARPLEKVSDTRGA